MIFKRTENKQDDGRRRPVIASPPPLWAQRLIGHGAQRVIQIAGTAHLHELKSHIETLRRALSFAQLIIGMRGGCRHDAMRACVTAN